MTKSILNNILMKFLLDAFYSIFIICNLVIFVWRSIWDLQDYYLQDNLCLNYWISLLGSYSIIFFVKIFQRSFYKQILRTHAAVSSISYNKFANIFDIDDYIDTNNTDYSYLVGKYELKLYILLFAVANINHWRGIWSLTLFYTDNSYFAIFWIAFLSFAILIFIKRINSLLSVPFQINNDCIEVSFKIQPDNIMNYDNSKTYIYLPKWQYFVNFLYEYLTDFCTIQVWRSYWFYLDLKLFPQNPFNSALSCLVSGLFIYTVLYMAKMPLNKYLYKNHNNELLNNTKEVFDKKLFIQYYIKYFVHAIFVVIGFVGTVHIWRGLWLLQPMIYQDEKILIKVVICLVAIIASLFILSLLDRISGALSRGNCKDEVFFIKGKFIVIETLSTRIFPKRSIDKPKSNSCISRFKLNFITRNTVFNHYPKSHIENLTCLNSCNESENMTRINSVSPSTSIPSTTDDSNLSLIHTISTSTE